jgi:hypothetical protein
MHRHAPSPDSNGPLGGWLTWLVASLLFALLVSCGTTGPNVVSQTLAGYRTNVTTFADFKRDANLTIQSVTRSTLRDLDEPPSPVPQHYVTSRSSAWRIYEQDERIGGMNLLLQPKYRQKRFVVGDARRPLFKLTFVNGTLTELESLQ